MSDLAFQVQQADPFKFWFFWGMAFVAAVGTFYYAFRSWRRARLIEDVPTAKIRSAHQGYVELEGMGRPMDGEPIIAPLSTKRCIWYRYKVEKKETNYRDGRTETRWRTVEQGVSDSLFHLEDGTGRCVVDPEGAEVTVSDKLVWYGETTRPLSAPLIGGSRIGLDGNYRYTESVMLPGQPLYIIGDFKSISAVDGYTQAEMTRDLIRTWKQDQAAMLKRFDVNDDGKLSDQEWQLVRAEAKRQTTQEFQRRAREPDIHIIAKPEEPRHPFLMSVYPQDQLTRRYRMMAGLSLAAFFAAGIIAVWLMNVRLG